MIRIKTPQEIATLAEGGKLLAELLDELETKVQPGVTGRQLDSRARAFCEEHNVIPSFLNYGGRGHDPFPAALCVSVNEGVVHGVPGDQPFQAGDLVGIDMGIIYHGLYLDSARSVIAGPGSPEAEELLWVTKEALRYGIEAAHIGNTTGHIGEAIQTYVESQGEYGIVRQLVGHGVGYGVHEDPQVPNFGRAGQGAELVEGLVIAIEPMITIGDPAVTTARDGWTIITRSGNIAAHQEHTVAITREGPKVLTSN